MAGGSASSRLPTARRSKLSKRCSRWAHRVVPAILAGRRRDEPTQIRDSELTKRGEGSNPAHGGLSRERLCHRDADDAQSIENQQPPTGPPSAGVTSWCRAGEDYNIGLTHRGRNRSRTRQADRSPGARSTTRSVV